MLRRDENGVLVSADKISDVTNALKDTEKKISKAMKNKDKLTEEENSELIKAASELQPLLSLVTPEMQKESSPMDVIAYVKQVVGIKKIADALKELNND